MTLLAVVLAPAALVAVLAAGSAAGRPMARCPARPAHDGAPPSWCRVGRLVAWLRVAAVPATAVLDRRGARRRRRAIAARLPEVIEMLVLAVHAGSSPAQAIGDVRPLVDPAIRPAFEAVSHRMQRGRRLADAVHALPEHLGHRASGVADAIAAADRYGLPLGPVLDALADDARTDRRRLGEEHARSLSVKLSFPLVVCTLPAFVLITIVPAVLGALSSLPTSPLGP